MRPKRDTSRILWLAGLGPDVIGFVLRFDLVDRSVAFNVAAKVEDQAIFLAGMQTKAAADALIKQARRHRGTQHHHAIDSRCVETGGEHVYVAEKA